MKKEKNIRYDGFIKQLDEQNIRLDEQQKKFAKSILSSEAYIPMQGHRSGKTWLFGLIENYMSDELKDRDFIENNIQSEIPNIIPESEDVQMRAPIIDDIILVYLQKLEKLNQEERKVITNFVEEWTKPIIKLVKPGLNQ